MSPPHARWLIGAAILFALAWRGLERSYPLLPGSVTFTLALPAGVAGEACALVTTGQTDAGDLLYLRYVDPTTVVFGYDSWGVGGPESVPLPFTPGVARPLVIEMPSLAAPPSVDRRARGPLRIVYDGREVLRENVHYFGRAPREIYFGTNPMGGTVANAALRGQLATVDGQPVVGRPAALYRWPARLRQWVSADPTAVLLALVVAIAGAFLAPAAFRFGAKRVWCRRIEPEFAGHSRAPHVTFAITAAVCAGIFLTVITGFTFRLFHPESFGRFYDYQIVSLLAGKLDVPAIALEGEAFVFQGKYYGYFGPTPALLRLPFALVGVGFGRLSRCFMVVDYLACLAAVYALLIDTARFLSRRRTWPARADVVLLVGSAGLGSTLFFVSSRAYIYHEAIICGAACALWAVWGGLRWLAAPAQHRWWILNLVCGVLAVHSRPPAGLFALTFLGCAAATILVRRWRSATPRPTLAALRTPCLVGVLSVLGVLSFNGLSYLKFRSFEGAPLKYHVQYHPARLANIGDGNFHLGNIPYGFDTYVWRPDFSFRPTFPYFYIQGRDPGEYPGTRMDLAENTLALPYTMPSLVFLAGLACLIALFRWPASRRPLVALAAGAAPMSIALFAAIAVSQRYTADFAPFLIATAAFGLAGLVTLPAAAGRSLYSAAAVLAAAAVLVTFALTLHYQGEGVWGVPDEVKAHYLSLRRHMDLLLGFSRP